jgi:hypothetical protein
VARIVDEVGPVGGVLPAVSHALRGLLSVRTVVRASRVSVLWLHRIICNSLWLHLENHIGLHCGSIFERSKCTKRAVEMLSFFCRSCSPFIQFQRCMRMADARTQTDVVCLFVCLGRPLWNCELWVLTHPLVCHPQVLHGG